MGRSALKAWAGRPGSARSSSRFTSVEHARRLAHRRVPAPVENYVEGGAAYERTLKSNVVAVRSVQLLPRLGITTGDPPLTFARTVLGREVSMPLLLSPVGFTRTHAHGRRQGRCGLPAGAAGTIFTLSSMSGHLHGGGHGCGNRSRLVPAVLPRRSRWGGAARRACPAPRLRGRRCHDGHPGAGRPSPRTASSGSHHRSVSIGGTVTRMAPFVVATRPWSATRPSHRRVPARPGPCTRDQARRVH